MHSATSCLRLSRRTIRGRLRSVLVVSLAMASPASPQADKTYLYAGVVSVNDPAGNEHNAGAGVYLADLEAPRWQPIAWQQLPIRALCAIEEQAGPTLLIGGDEGILRPFANPTGWKLLTDWRVRDVLDLQPDPFQAQTIYAASGLGVLLSEDGGASWTLSNRGLTETFVSCLLPDPLIPGRVLAGTESGMYASKDYAHSWQPLALSGVAIRAMLRQRLDPGRYWVGTEYHGLVASHDGGYVFTPVPLGEDSLSIYCLAGGMAGGPVVAGTFERGLFVAHADDALWQHVDGSEQLGTVLALVTLDSRGELYAGLPGNGVMKSTDGGVTWVPFGLDGAEVRKLLLSTFAQLP